jgi:hypothetical protein
VPTTEWRAAEDDARIVCTVHVFRNFVRGGAGHCGQLQRAGYVLVLDKAGNNK